MLLYANGCSMTYGAELGGMGSFAETERENKYRIEHAWPNQLGKLLNMQSINDAKGGSSNDRITRTTLEWISKYRSEGKDLTKLFVVIGWSGEQRREFLSNRGEWYDLLPHWIPKNNKPIAKITKIYIRYFFNRQADVIRSTIHFITLQSFFKVHNIPYLFFNALHEYILKDFNTEAKHLYKLIDFRRFYLVDGGMYKNSQEYPVGPNNHPLEKGHKVWANQLYDCIIKRGLLNV